MPDLLTEIQNAEFKEAFDEFDKVLSLRQFYIYLIETCYKKHILTIKF